MFRNNLRRVYAFEHKIRSRRSLEFILIKLLKAPLTVIQYILGWTTQDHQGNCFGDITSLQTTNGITGPGWGKPSIMLYNVLVSTLSSVCFIIIWLIHHWVGGSKHFFKIINISDHVKQWTLSCQQMTCLHFKRKTKKAKQSKYD